MKSKLFAGVLVFYSVPVFAYLDPASSSALIFSSWAIIFIGLLFFTKIFQYIFSFFCLLSRRINPFKKWDIVVHCEFDAYCPTFYNFLKLNSDLQILIVGSENSCNSFSEQSNPYLGKLAFVKINTLFFQVSVLRGIIASNVITSTTGLGCGYYGRGYGVGRYIYLAHSASDVHYFDLMAFDHFDLIFCPNINIKNNIEFLLKRRGNAHMPIIKIVSLQYLNYSKPSLQDINDNKGSLQTLLLAPSWGDSGLLSILDEKLLDRIACFANSNRLKIIFRPHPQAIRSKDARIEYVSSYFLKNSLGYELDLCASPFNSLFNAKILVSDFSSIIYDYHFVIKNPITLCYFDKKKFDHVLKEEMFIEIESLEELEYRNGTYFCESYDALNSMLSNSMLNSKFIDVENLFIHEENNHFLDLKLDK